MEYTSVNKYIKETYGYKMYKIALNTGYSCPNRDGTAGTGGCIFCSAGGSGDFAESSLLSVTEQIESGKKRIENKFKANDSDRPCYIAYFQAYTGTYAPIDILKKDLYMALNHPDIAIISVATRPDCLGSEVLSLLDEINKIKPVWIELGLQTVSEETARFINRCYPLSTYDNAVSSLNNLGIKVITHLIIGLPGETKEDMLNSVKHAVDTGTWGIKLQLLHVLKNTRLHEYYLSNPFHILTLKEYTDIICDCLKVIPRDVVIHRITGDGPKNILVEPTWSGNKKNVLNTLNKAISEA